MFERTWAGQQNRAAFLDVEIVCYVEGGEDPSSSVPDTTFWSIVFGTLCPGKSIRCVPKGGKPILEALARRVVDGEIKNVIIAMDADYDHATGDVIDDSRVFYTWGYSWENDVFMSDNSSALYGAFTHCGQISVNAQRHISDEIARIYDELKWSVRGDHIALCRGTSLLPRGAPGRIIAEAPGGSGPVVRKGEVLKLWKEARARMNFAPVAGNVHDIGRFLVGHYVQHAMVVIMRNAAARFHRSMVLTPSALRDLALQLFRQFLIVGTNSAVIRHHRDQCARML